MIVPNYVPDPLEVPGNVTEERYGLRLAFIRRVTIYHAISLLWVSIIAFLPLPSIGLWPAGIALSALLIALDIVRIAFRGNSSEAKWSTWSLPFVLIAAAWFARQLGNAGVPVWSLLAGPVCVLVYTLLCGRDYSFIGCWTLSLIASSVTVAALADERGLTSQSSLVALCLNGIYLTYVVYDLASLMARRRRGEEIAAVVDLYRDVFNFFGYAVRMVRHWHKHRIWIAPR